MTPVDFRVSARRPRHDVRGPRTDFLVTPGTPVDLGRAVARNGAYDVIALAPLVAAEQGPWLVGSSAMAMTPRAHSTSVACAGEGGSVVDVPDQIQAPLDPDSLSAAVYERSDEVAAGLAELSRLLLAEETLETTLQRVADLAVRTIPDCDAAGVTLYLRDSYITAAYTDERVLPIDRGQYDTGEGPCLEAIHAKKVNRAVIEEACADYPRFVDAALAEGIRSFLAAPLIVQGRAIGALNLYSRQPHGFEPLDELVISLYTGQAAVAVANANVYRDAMLLAEQLQEAIASRAVIEQAKGVLAARRGICVEEAFELLRTWSQTRNVKLRQIAQEVVSSAVVIA